MDKIGKDSTISHTAYLVPDTHWDAEAGVTLLYSTPKSQSHVFLPFPSKARVNKDLSMRIWGSTTLGLPLLFALPLHSAESGWAHPCLSPWDQGQFICLPPMFPNTPRTDVQLPITPSLIPKIIITLLLPFNDSPFIHHSFNRQFIEQFVLARHYSRHWEFKSEQKIIPAFIEFTF